MSSVNLTVLMGNIGHDPELRFTASGTPVCTLRMATNEYFKSKDGRDQQRTEWHQVVVWGKSAEACAKVLKKGRLIHVQGRLQTRNWKDRDGGIHYTTEIVAQRVQFLPTGTAQVAAKGEAVAADASEHAVPTDEDLGAEVVDMEAQTQKVQELDPRDVTF